LFVYIYLFSFLTLISILCICHALVNKVVCEDGAKIIMVKKSPWCNNVQLNNVQLLIRYVVWQSSRC